MSGCRSLSLVSIPYFYKVVGQQLKKCLLLAISSARGRDRSKAAKASFPIGHVLVLACGISSFARIWGQMGVSPKKIIFFALFCLGQCNFSESF